MERGPDRDEQLDALARRAVDRHGAPGVLIGVVGPDGVRVGAAGVAAAATTDPVTVDAAANWFSMTKIATATTAMALVDQGRLDLDDPVADHLGEIWPDAFATVRVRHLLSHSSGLANPIPIRWVHAAGDPRPDPRAFLGRLLAKHGRPKFEPGTRAAYTNVGYLALGQVLAAATGRPFEEVLRHEVLGPLGMMSTTCSWTDQPGPDALVAHQPMRRPTAAVIRRLLPDGLLGERTGRLVALRPFDIDGAAYGGLVGPIGDALALLALHARGGSGGDGPPVLSDATRARMSTIETPGRPYDLGLGWFRPRKDAGPRVLHFGGGMGYWHVLRLDPQLGVGACVLSNTGRRWDITPVADEAIDRLL